MDRVKEPRTSNPEDRATSYELSVQKPTRIIVKNGRVDLEGVVDSQADKNLVNIRANSVPGIFSVKNNLRVVKSRTRAAASN